MASYRYMTVLFKQNIMGEGEETEFSFADLEKKNHTVRMIQLVSNCFCKILNSEELFRCLI